MYEIEFPNPQPGQKSKPKFPIGHIVKWVSPGLWIKAKYRRDEIQTAASNPIILKNCFRFFN